MNEVTRADIDGLRADIQRFADAIDGLASKADLKVTDDQVQEVRRLAKRANINSTIAVAALVVAFIVGGITVRSFETQRTESRTADCHSLDSLGVAIKAGVSVLRVPNPTPDQQARLDQFVAEYDRAVDAAITTAKKNKGYATDCSTVSNPPGG